MKKNGIKPTKLEKEMQLVFTSVISSTPTQEKVKKILPKIKDWEKDISTTTKEKVRRLLKK